MKIKIEERKNEAVLFLTPKTMSDAALILRLSGSMKCDNTGYAYFRDREIKGWISVPLKKEIKSSLYSGRRR